MSKSEKESDWEAEGRADLRVGVGSPLAYAVCFVAFNRFESRDFSLAALLR
jgi:hypothetical protein